MSNQAKQRFLELNVNEISVVDKPAIEVEFLVTKRLEDDKMAGENTATTEKGANGAEIVSIEHEVAGDDAAVNKALETVASMVENIAKAVGVRAEQPVPATPVTEVQLTSTEVDAEKAKTTPHKLYKAAMEKAGVAGDELTKAMEAFDKAMPPWLQGKDTAKSVDAPATSVAPATEQPTEEQQAQKALELLGQAVEKARKFTPARVDQLKAIVGQLQKLLGDVTEVPAGTSPGVSTPTGTGLGASSVTKLIGGIEALTTAVNKSIIDQQTLATRIEAIEKARQPSKALDNESNDGSIETTTKNNKAFWKGIL